jgi:hypothetical protein
MSIPIFTGCVYFYLVNLLGFPDPFDIFEAEFTLAGQTVVLRNPSFFGSSLVLCGASLVQFLLAQYMSKIRGELIYVIFSFISLMNIGMSLSRRAWLPVAVFYFTLILLNPRRHGFIFILGFSLTVGFILSFNPDLFYVLADRFISSFDIISDSSNVSRLELMFAGISDILLKPWGLGFGTLSSIGYTVDEVHKLQHVRVTESSLISFVGEVGILVAFTIFVVLLKYTFKMRTIVILLFLNPLLFESIVGLGLYSPLVSFFTISVFLIIYYFEQDHKITAIRSQVSR